MTGCRRAVVTSTPPRLASELEPSSRAPAGSAARAAASEVDRRTPPRRGLRPARTPGRRRPGQSPTTTATGALPAAAGVLRRARGPPRPRLRRLVGGPRARLRARLRRPARPRGDGGVAARLRPAPTPSGPLEFHRLPGHDLDLEAHSTLFSGEQSNSSVAFGEDALMKVFRKVTPGREPRHRGARGADRGRLRPRRRALRLARGRRRRRDGAAAPAGDAPAVPPHRQRRLGARPGQRAQPVRRGRPARRRGRRRLRRRGRAAGRVARRGARTSCAEHFPDARAARPTSSASSADGDDRPARRRARRRARAGGARRRAARDLRRRRRPRRRAGPAGARRPAPGPDPAHRRRAGRSSTSRASPPSRSPSGCCRTRRGATWPGCCAPSTTPPRVAERYASHGADDTGAEQRAYRAAEWAERNCEAFLSAYAGRELTPDEQTLLDAYVADKAVYETVYEARNRPTWVPVPLDRCRAACGAEQPDAAEVHHGCTSGERRRAGAAGPRRPRPPPRDPRTAHQRRRRDGARLQAAGQDRQGDLRRPEGQEEQRRAGPRVLRHLGRRAARADVPDYRVEVDYGQGATTVDDPYRFLPTLGEMDLHLINEGRHELLWTVLGAHLHRYDGLGSAGRGHLLRRVGAAGQGRADQGRLQQLGRPRAPDAPARALGRVGAVRARRRLRRRSTSSSSSAPTASGARRPTRWPSTPRLRRRRRRWSSSRPTRWGDDDWMTAPRRRAARARPDVGLRDAPRLVEEALGRRRLHLRAARRRPGALPRRPRLHPRRVPAGDGAPVRRLVGLPGDVVLRPDGAVRRPRRLPLPRRPAAPGRHRRDRRLGARALPEGHLRAVALRRHAALRGPEPAPWRAPRLGHLRLQLRPPRGAQLPGRQRALLARGVPHRRPPGGCRRDR